MKIKKEPQEIFREYEDGKVYKSSITDKGLYEQVKQNENFYNGNQWEGVNAPNLDKPVFNILKRVVSYFDAMMVSDDIAVSAEFFQATDETKLISDILGSSIDEVLENSKLRVMFRDSVRDCVVDGDSAIYFRFNDEIETGQIVKGAIEAELIDNTNVYFGNPYSRNVQKQPYIIVSQRLFINQVKDMARENGISEDIIDEIQASNESQYQNDEKESKLVTVLTKFWKEDGYVHEIKCTEKCIIEEESIKSYTLYPIAYWSWEQTKNSYHGVSPITALIPNQIFINKLFAMCMLFVTNMGFPKVMYDSARLKAVTNDFTSAMGVSGLTDNRGIADSIIQSTKPIDFSNQIIALIETVIQYTKELMGASDAALGDIKPDNTSAIIAVQEASAIPLQIQRLQYFQFVEDCIRIVIDLMANFYGTRVVKVQNEMGDDMFTEFDFTTLQESTYRLNIDIGTSAYWNELTQIQTLNNLFSQQVIDAIDLVEGMPSKYFKGKDKILAKLKERVQQQELQAQTQSMMLTQDDVMSGLSPEQQSFVQSNPQAMQEALAQVNSN